MADKCYASTHPIDPQEQGLPVGAQDAGEQGWIEWCYNLYNNSDNMVFGVLSGLVFGAPIVKDGKVVGYTPSVLPEGLESATTRTKNWARCLVPPGVSYHPLIFAYALWRGLKKSVTDIYDLAKDLLYEGQIYGMIKDGMNAIAASDTGAYKLGQVVGGGLVGNFFGKMDGTFAEAVDAIGEFIGSILLDIILGLITWGGGTLIKGGLSVASKGVLAFGRVSAETVETATKLAQRGLRTLDDQASNFIDAMQLVDTPALSTAGGFGSPGRVPTGFNPRRNFMFSEMADDASKGVGQAARSGTGSSPSPRQAPDLTPAGSTSPPVQPLSPKAAAPGAAAGRASKLISSAELANRQAQETMRLARHGEIFIAPIVRQAGDGFFSVPPTIGGFLSHIRGGRVLGRGYDDLIGFLRFQSQSANAGGVRYMDAAVHSMDANLTKFEIPGSAQAINRHERFIRTHSQAIFQPKPAGIRREHYPNYNRPRGAERPNFLWDSPWEGLSRDWYNHILPILKAELHDRPDLVRLISQKWDALHAFGPGAGDEIALGMGFGSDFINRKVQAGSFRKSQLGIESARDARRGSELASALEVVGTRERELFGLEGYINALGHALVGVERAGTGRFPEGSKLLINTFTESWGDELLHTPMFQIAAEQGSRLKPQHFVRQVEYHVQIVVPRDGQFIPVHGTRIEMMIEMAPPPFFDRAIVSVGKAPEGALSELDFVSTLTPFD
ncbi:hypothetical protein [Aliiroseovarius marinus]|uniref:hypothetical protein n=1 Tax=Aliiroseovarius marinus TaxID=2500159 RepID=UPI00105B7228|nr:hypothetical protein [Aliiroseovarius marinus]